jgi:RNA polymerase primary sigma factor
LPQRDPPASISTLSAERERELVVDAARGDRAACRELVDSFLPAIGGVARRVDAGGRVDRTELMQEGVVGLLFAVGRYDPRMNTPFWAYASFWVRKGMQELIAEVTRPFALSDHAVRGLAKIAAARRDHVRTHGAEPTGAELAAATGFTRAQLDTLLTIDRTPLSFEEPVGADEGTTASFGETVADPGAERAYERVLDRMETRAVRDLAEELDERERTVLWSHYGLGQAPQTLTAIGARLGLTAERVRQIEQEALAKLREAAVSPARA